MPIELSELRAAITPSKATLLLGAGSSIPSGAPSAAELSRGLWKDVAHSDAQSEDLLDTASVLERRYSREVVVRSVIARLQKLQPTGGILGLPNFGWYQIFTTNYDKVVERAYQKAHVPLTVIRSNYDFTTQESRVGTRLYKIHGCITQDRSLGDKASMILSERDYEEHRTYRQTMFATLRTAMHVGDIIIVGHSLRDRHLSDLVKEVLDVRDQGVPGRVYVLIYDRDDLRAPLLEDRGAKVAFGGIDDFVHALATSQRASDTPPPESANDILPLSLVSTVHNVAVLKAREPSTTRMFNGAPASYADIESGTTFERAQYLNCSDDLKNRNYVCLSIIGSAGIGKTTFARQLLKTAADDGMLAFEHHGDFMLSMDHWRAAEAEWRRSGRFGVLMIDDCARFMRQVNLLVDHLASVDCPALHLVLTSNSSQWTPRVKTPKMFSHGRVVELGRLEDTELNSLLNLVEYNPEVSSLVSAPFRRESRQQQLRKLRERCDADMFVCLKNIFGNENLDNILLKEYNELDETYREHYRHVAALEAFGARVHRQLVIRMLGLRADMVGNVLGGLDGIIEEYDIDPSKGVYGWSTRHMVIARKIADYKFSGAVEIQRLFENVIDNLNPAVLLELYTIRGICGRDYGIGRIGDASIRVKLYRRLIEIAPGERIPRHQLIREYLHSGAFEDAEFAIRDAVDSVGQDAPIDRYRVRLLMVRALNTPDIEDGDRLALLRRAYETASENLGRHRGDKYSFRTLCEVAVKLVEHGEAPQLLDEAIVQFRAAAERLLDPDMAGDLRRYEDVRARM